MQTQITHQENSEWISKKEAVRILSQKSGHQMTTGYVARLARRKQIRAPQVDGQVVYHRGDVEAWRVKPSANGTTYITYICQRCGESYQRIKGNRSGQYCTPACAAKVTGEKSAQRLYIPDGQPMSKRTKDRRKKAAGLVRPYEPIVFDETFFDTWSDEMAWLLGLIWSDGCLLHYQVEICSKDKPLIELVATVIKGGRFGTKNRGQHFNIYFGSQQSFYRLRELGLTKRKSLTIQWPSGLPLEYEGSFLRGLIDGDGTVGLYQRRPNQYAPDLAVGLVTASPTLIEALRDCYTRHDLRFSVSCRDNSLLSPKWSFIWRIAVSEQESLRRLYSLLYPSNEVPCLQRKRAPYDTWMATPRRVSGRPPGEQRAPEELILFWVNEHPQQAADGVTIKDLCRYGPWQLAKMPVSNYRETLQGLISSGYNIQVSRRKGRHAEVYSFLS